MCLVDPGNVSLLTTFGTAFFVAGVVSLLTGQTYYRGLIARSDEPVQFWIVTLGLVVIGGGCLVGLMVCPRG